MNSRKMGVGTLGGIVMGEDYQGKSKASVREVVLDTAKQYVLKDRQSVYDTPERNFEMIAKLWSAYLGADVKTHDVPAMMALLKVARLKGSPTHMDNWIDMAGYAACGAEVASPTE